MSPLAPVDVSLPEMQTLPRLLTTREVARALRVDPRTIKRWAAEGRLQRVQLAPGTTRYRADAVAALIEAHNDHEPRPGLVEKVGGADAATEHRI
jgi:excisionase family DNA binding protein